MLIMSNRGPNLVAEACQDEAAYHQVRRGFQEVLVNSIDRVHPGFRQKALRGNARSFFCSLLKP